MKQLFMLAGTLASLALQGQNKYQTQKILVGFSFSPDYNSRTLKNNDGSASSDLVIKSRNDIEVARFGYTAGLNICFNFSASAGFETGIQFSDRGYRTKKQDLLYFPPDPFLQTRAKTVYAYQYLGIPLKAKFSFGKEKVRFITGIGFITNLLLNVKQTTNYEYADGRTEKKSRSSTSGFNKVDLSPVISIGIDYRLNKKIRLFAEPVFRYGIIKTNDAPVTEHLWNAGLNLGFYHALK